MVNNRQTVREPSGKLQSRDRRRAGQSGVSRKATESTADSLRSPADVEECWDGGEEDPNSAAVNLGRSPMAARVGRADRGGSGNREHSWSSDGSESGKSTATTATSSSSVDGGKTNGDGRRRCGCCRGCYETPFWSHTFWRASMSKLVASMFWNAQPSMVTDISAAMNMWPLKFTDEKLEAKFFQVIQKSYPVRLVVSGILNSVAILLFWALCGSLMSLKGSIRILNSYDPLSLPLLSAEQALYFHGTCAALMVAQALLMLSPRIPLLKRNLEISFYCLSALGIVVSFSFVLYLLSSTVKLSKSALPIDFVEVWTMKVWTDTIAIWTYVTTLYACDMLLPTRSSTSWILHIVMSVGAMGTYLAYGFRLAKLGLFPACTIQSAVLVFLAAWGFVSSYSSEIKNRAQFFEYSLTSERVATMWKEMQRWDETRRTHETPIEEIVSLVKQCKVILQGLRLREPVDLAKGKALLGQTLHILLHTDDLYTMRPRLESPVDGTEDQKDVELRNYFAEQYNDTKRRVARPSGNTPDSADVISSGGTPPSASFAEWASVLPTDLQEKIGVDFSLSMMKLCAESDSPVVEVGRVLLKDDVKRLSIAPEIMWRFLSGVEDAYVKTNPYHNAMHAAFVAHLNACFIYALDIPKCSFVDASDILACFIAALAHDMGHPGRNNAFFINTHHPLAVIFNDTSVLENMHSCLLFRLLEKPGYNIFASTAAEVYKGVRKSVIDLILCTDMKSHFSFVSRFRVKSSAPDFDPLNNVDDVWLTLKLCLKAADLGHVAADWIDHQAWSFRIQEEFYQQGEEESELRVALSPLCDRSLHCQFANSQKGFIEFVVQPLMRELDDLDRSQIIGQQVVAKMEYNRFKWDLMAKENIEIAIPSDVRRLTTRGGKVAAPRHVGTWTTLRPAAMKRSHTAKLPIIAGRRR